MGVNPLAALPDGAAVTLAGASTDGPDREVVMLLLHVDVALVQRELAPLVELLVERLVMMASVHLRQVMEEAAVSVARF